MAGHLTATVSTRHPEVRTADVLAALDPCLRIEGWGPERTVLRKHLTEQRAELEFAASFASASRSQAHAARQRRQRRGRAEHQSNQPQIFAGQLVADGISEGAPRGAQHGQRQGRGQIADQRKIDRDIQHDRDVNHPRNPRAPRGDSLESSKQQHRQEVLPQVSDGRPEGQRNVAAKQDQGSGEREYAEQADRFHCLTRFNRFSNTSETTTPSERLPYLCAKKSACECRRCSIP